MTSEEYEDFVNEGIAAIQANSKKIGQWKGLYPSIDVENEIFEAAGWLLDRTEETMDRRPRLVQFVGNWLRYAFKKRNCSGSPHAHIAS